MLEIVQNCSGSSKLCEKVRKRLGVRISAGNDLECEYDYVQEKAKSAIPHPPHLIVASVCL